MCQSISYKNNNNNNFIITILGFGRGSHHGQMQIIELCSITSPRSGFKQFFGYFCLHLSLWSSLPCNYLMVSKNEADSTDFKQARGDILSMVVSSPLNEESIQEEIEESDTVEPNLKDIHILLKNIQSAITVSSDVVELRKVIAKNNNEVGKLKKDLVSQNKYVSSLELELGRVKKASKQQKSDIEELQENLDELEQYTRKNSVQFHGIPEDVGIPTDEIICKVAQVVDVEMELEKIEISHHLKRKKGIKPITAEFANQKDKAKCYKARIRLKDVTLSTIFLTYLEKSLADQRVFINENLTGY